MILVKWGGSLLTNKASSGRARYRLTLARRLAQELAAGLDEAKDRAVLVHGAGSFGHPLARTHRVGTRRLQGSTLRRALVSIQAQVRALERHVVKTLRSQHLPAVGIPASLFAFGMKRGLWVELEPVLESLAERQLPVTGGTILYDQAQGARILSGDELLWHLARRLRPRRVVFATDVGGVVLEGRLLWDVPPAAARRIVGRLDGGKDATGGMRGKVAWASRLQQLGVETWILDGSVPGRLQDAVAGRRPVGTRFAAGLHRRR